MRPFRAIRTVGLPAGLSLLVLAADCGSGTGVDCDPTTILNLTIGVEAKESLDAGNCISEGDPGDIFRFSLTQPTWIRATVSSDKFEPEMTIGRAPFASPNDQVMFESGKPARGFVYLPAGDYMFEVESATNSMGAYTVTTVVGAPTGCPQGGGTRVYSATGITIAGAFTTDDCNPQGPYIDGFLMYFVAGRTYTVTLKGAFASLHAEVSKEGAIVAGGGSSSTTGTMTLTYTPTASGYYSVNVTPGRFTGPYTLSVTP